MMMKDMMLLHENVLTEYDDNDGSSSESRKWIGSYGPHLLIDCHQCDASTFTRKSIRAYMKKLCKIIGMKRCKLIFWDDKWVPEKEKQTEPHTVGTSAVQFILTSNIVIHTLDKLGRVYVDIFSCKLFNAYDAKEVTQEWFKSKLVGTHLIERK